MQDYDAFVASKRRAEVATGHKPGDCETRVTHGDDLPVMMWQKYASPIWTDINQGRTLNKLPARDENDEKHMCPLQLDVIERCIHLWTNKGIWFSRRSLELAPRAIAP